MHPISYFQGAVLGLLQGVSELFPVSSLGHSVILPSLLGWNIHQNEPYFLTFLVAVHLATALVLLGFFWQDWVRIVKGLGRSLRDREITDPDAKLGWLLVVGTIPAGILGLTLQDYLRKLFASPEYASIFLALNGVLLFGAELLRRRAPVVAEDDDERIARTVGWRAVGRRRRGAVDRAHPGLLALGRGDGRRAARRPLAQGRGALRVPARHADHLRRGRAQAARPRRLAGERRARAGARGRALLGADAPTSRCASSCGTSRRGR